MSDSYRVVRRPLMTEKNTNRSERRNEYTFEVEPCANKIQIRRAVEELFNVKVVDVRTSLKKGLARRVGSRQTMDSDVKKAVVKLAEGYKIDLI